MSWALHSLLWLGGILGTGAGQEPIGFLYQPAYCVDQVLRGPATPYCPQPGDLFFCTDYTVFWTVTHNWAGAGHPHHSGIVVARPDGRLALLEAGPCDTLRIRVDDIESHLIKYTELGEPIWFRRRRIPLTPEQCEQLTAFAMQKEGHRFALIRQGAQLTPFRSRGPLINCFAHPHPNRDAYFCSELVTESLVAAGLLSPCDARPAATYPSDLFFDRSANRFINEHLNLSADWDPPARWLGFACPEAGMGSIEQ